MRAPRRYRRAVAALAGALALAGCDARGTVRIAVAEDGSGEVTVSAALDAAAVEQLGDVRTAVVLDDLTAAGWTVAEPRTTGELTVLEASKDFGRPEDLAAVLDEVSGPDGLFRDVDLEVSDGFASTRYELTGRVVASGSLTDFGDDGIAELLDGQRVGYSPEELALLLAADDSRVRLDIEVSLPGGERSDTTLDLAGGTPTDLSIDTGSTVRHATAVFWLVIAGASALATAALILLAGPRGRGEGRAGADRSARSGRAARPATTAE